MQLFLIASQSWAADFYQRSCIRQGCTGVQSLIDRTTTTEAPATATGFAGKRILLLVYFVLSRGRQFYFISTEYKTVD